MTDTMPVTYRPMVTWYKPEPAAAVSGYCFCRRPATGRTCYWDGQQLSYRNQCEQHVPSEAARFEDGVPA